MAEVAGTVDGRYTRCVLAAVADQMVSLIPTVLDPDPGRSNHCAVCYRVFPVQNMAAALEPWKDQNAELRDADH